MRVFSTEGLVFCCKEEELISAYLASLIFVVLAEMGDKTQLLAMAFATRYRWQTVMWGVFVATLCNHLLAVFVGHYLTNLLPMRHIQTAAAASFILFGLWTLRGDTLHGEDKRFNFSPFWTVAVAFFFAEMGDKTQLATVALAAKFQSIMGVWLGTTTGMLVADAIGIGVGIVLGKKLPDRLIKWLAALIFIVFGVIGLYDSLPLGWWVSSLVATGFLLIVLLAGMPWRSAKGEPVAGTRADDRCDDGKKD